MTITHLFMIVGLFAAISLAMVLVLLTVDISTDRWQWWAIAALVACFQVVGGLA
jgi:hypothetical protein